MPKAPFERVGKRQDKHERPTTKSTQADVPKVRSRVKKTGRDRTRPEGSAKSPGALINRRAADRLRAGHLWVYASDIESIESVRDRFGGGAPALLPVADSRGLLLGTALYSPASQIALRLISREAIDEAAWLELLAARLRRAIRWRKPLLTEQTNACRLCFSEADELPGVVIDKYAELVILQLLAKGLRFIRSARDLRARVARRTGAGCHSGASRSTHSRTGGIERAQPGAAVCREVRDRQRAPSSG